MSVTKYILSVLSHRNILILKRHVCLDVTNRENNTPTSYSAKFRFQILIKFCCVFSHMFQEISGIASRIRLRPISSTFFLINVMTIVHISTIHIWSYRVSGIILWIIVTLIMYKMSRNETSISNYTGYTAVSSIWQQLWNEGWHLSPASCANAGCLKTDTPGNTSIFFCFFLLAVWQRGRLE
jgi:hypothetical protein